MRVTPSQLQLSGRFTQTRVFPRLFLGLGTGLGSTLIAENIIIPLELGRLKYNRKDSFVDVLGKRGLQRLGKRTWRHTVIEIATILAEAFAADTVVLGGGNARARRTASWDADKRKPGSFSRWVSFVAAGRHPHSLNKKRSSPCRLYRWSRGVEDVVTSCGSSCRAFTSPGTAIHAVRAMVTEGLNRDLIEPPQPTFFLSSQQLTANPVPASDPAYMKPIAQKLC